MRETWVTRENVNAEELTCRLIMLALSIKLRQLEHKLFGRIHMIKKTLALSAVLLFAASSVVFACGAAHKKSVQSMKPTTVADGGQSVPAPATTTPLTQ